MPLGRDKYNLFISSQRLDSTLSWGGFRGFCSPPLPVSSVEGMFLSGRGRALFWGLPGSGEHAARGIGHSCPGLSRARGRVLKGSRVPWSGCWAASLRYSSGTRAAYNLLSVRREILLNKRQVRRIHILKTFEVQPFTYKYLYYSFPYSF